MARKMMMTGKQVGMGGARKMGKSVKPASAAIYRKRVAKPEPDDIMGAPKKRTNFPKGFI